MFIQSSNILIIKSLNVIWNYCCHDCKNICHLVKDIMKLQSIMRYISFQNGTEIVGSEQFFAKESHSCLFWEKKIRIIRSFCGNLGLQQSLQSYLGALMGRICQLKSSRESDCISAHHYIDLLQNQKTLFPAFPATHLASGSKNKDELLLIEHCIF